MKKDLSALNDGFHSFIVYFDHFNFCICDANINVQQPIEQKKKQFEPRWYIIFRTIFNIHHLYFKCRFYILDNVKWFVPHAYLNTKYQCNVFILLRGKSIRKKLNFWSTLPKVCLFSVIHHTVRDRYEIVNIIFLVLFRYINCGNMFALFGHHQSCPMCLKNLYIFIISVVSFTNLHDKFIVQTFYFLFQFVYQNST